MLEEGSTRRGRGHPCPPANQQLGPKREFHFADARRGGSKGKVGTRRPMRDATGLDDVPEQLQVREIEPHAGSPSYFAKAGYTKRILQHGNSGFKIRET